MKLSDYKSSFKWNTMKQKEWIDGKLNKKVVTKNELHFIKNWHSASKTKQCSYLIASIYAQIPDWNNMGYV